MMKEVILPSKFYNDFIQQYPPEPILPKNYGKGESPRSGGIYKFVKLARFRGVDNGKSMFREEA